jgi:hypothetical protein
MIKDLWINLPVNDVVKAKDFFKTIGFKLNPRHENNTQVGSLMVGNKPIIVMLFPNDVFQTFTNHAVADTQKGNEILLSFEMESPEKVDELAKKVVEAGGILYSQPQLVQGFMYGFGFIDLDGHRWNPTYMDWDKIK